MLPQTPRSTLFPYTTLFRSAKVQISVNQGQSWQDVYSQAGTGGGGETSFTNRTIPLAGFAAKSIQVRFSYNFSTGRSEEHTSELQSRGHLVCRLLLEKKKKK